VQLASESGILKLDREHTPDTRECLLSEIYWNGRLWPYCDIVRTISDVRFGRIAVVGLPAGFKEKKSFLFGSGSFPPNLRMNIALWFELRPLARRRFLPQAI